jgi:hypothetical protein
MRIEVCRTGGFAGMRRSWCVHLDHVEDPLELERLVDECDWANPPPPTPEPDRFSYTLTAGEQTATLSERALKGPWRDLVDRVVSLDER